MRIHPDKTVLHAGDDLDVRVELLPRSDFDIRHGKLELICTETYVQKTSSQYGTHYQKKTETRSSVGETFSDTGSLRSGVKYSTSVRLAVPPDAPRSIRGTDVRSIEPGITWEVRASLDVAKARNLQESQVVTVVEHPPNEVPPPRSVETEVVHRQCSLSLELSSTVVRTGDRLEGKLRAAMLQEVTASEVRVELVREEKFGNDAQDHVVEQLTLERELSLGADVQNEWRFKLNVGDVGVPSVKTEKSSVRWLVKGILARAMWPDLKVEQEIAADF